MKRLVSLFIFLFAASAGTAQTYRNYTDLFEDGELEEYKKEVNTRSGVFELVVEKVLTEWDFTLGNPSEGLHTQERMGKGEHIRLPHRITVPNTPFWYTMQAAFPGHGVLYIDADDGAQLFIDGKQVNRLEGEFFPIDSGEFRITIRVLNNAMAGGLRSVRFIKQKSYLDFLEKSKRRADESANVEKRILLRSPVKDHALSEYPLITGPYQTLDAGKIYIKAFSDQPIDLYTGPSGERMTKRIRSVDGKLRYAISDLPSQDFFYKIISGKTETCVFRLRRVNRDTDNSFSFNVWGDSQFGWKDFAQHIRDISKHQDAFGVAVGDLVGTGSEEVQWRQLLQMLGTSAAETPYYLVPGNHDYDGYYDSLYSKNYHRYISKENYFSWQHGSAAFIALDPNAFFPVDIPQSSAQYQWLVKTLRSDAWKQARWRFVFFHQPMYSQGWAGYSGEMSMRQLLEPLIESAQIDFIISGHTHDYERLTKAFGKQRTTFIVTGGGGGSLEPPESSAEPKMDVILKLHHYCRMTVHPSVVQLQVIDLQGKVIDEMAFRKE